MMKLFLRYSKIILQIGILLSGIQVKALNPDSLTKQVRSVADSAIINRALEDAYLMINQNSVTTQKIAETCVWLSLKTGYEKGQADAYALLGRVYRRRALYEKAISSYLQALGYFDKVKENRRISSICNDIAIICMNMEDYPNAIKYAEKGKKALMAVAPNSPGIVNINNLLGAAYFELNNIEKAYTYFNEAYNDAVRLNHRIEMSISLENLARVYLHKKELKNALQYINESNRIREELNDSESLGYGLTVKASILMEMKQYDQAMVSMKQAKIYADQLHLIELQAGILSTYIDYYKRVKDYKKAYEYQDQLRLFSDTVRNAETAKKIAEIETLYDTEKKEQENHLLRQENALNEANLGNATFRQRVLVASIIALIILVSVVLYFLLQKQRLNKRLYALNAEKNRIMAILSHDLKTPLVKIHTYAQLLKQRSNKTEQMDTIQHIEELAVESGDMIQNLLDVTNIEDRKPSLHISEVDVLEDVELVIEEHYPMAKRKGIMIYLDVSLDELVIQTDRQKLKRVLDNLFSNAIKYSPFNGHVYVDLKEDENNILLSIKDEGRGIHETEMPRLFTRYGKLESTPTGGESSTGMGLFIVKYLCDLMGGNVTCESTVNKGSIFRVMFPKTMSEQPV